jgi:hypothetical protein
VLLSFVSAGIHNALAEISFESHRVNTRDVSMTMSLVIEYFNVVEHALPVWFEIDIEAVVCPFVLQAPEEPFSHRVVVTVTRFAVAGGDYQQSARVWNSASARTVPTLRYSYRRLQFLREFTFEVQSRLC